MHFTIFVLQFIVLLSEARHENRFAKFKTFSKYCDTFSQKLMEKAVDSDTQKFPEKEEKLLEYCEERFRDAEGYKVTIDDDNNVVIIKEGEEEKTHAECNAELQILDEKLDKSHELKKLSKAGEKDDEQNN